VIVEHSIPLARVQVGRPQGKEGGLAPASHSSIDQSAGNPPLFDHEVIPIQLKSGFRAVVRLAYSRFLGLFPGAAIKTQEFLKGVAAILVAVLTDY